MLAVGAISLTDNQKASFSNYSSEIIQVAAPGSSGVYSITPGNTYGVKEGTSMATPLISGAAALVIGFLKARGEEVTPALVERLILEGSDRAEHLTPYFQEGRTLNYLSLARKIQAEYRVRQVQLPASDGLQIDAGITSSFLLNRDSVEVQGYLCNRQLEPDARVLVQTGSEMEEIPVTWDYNFAWKGECFLGNVVQHVFSGVHPVAAQKANYYLQVGSNPPKLLPRVY
jgi:subtilisin family serine protease